MHSRLSPEDDSSRWPHIDWSKISLCRVLIHVLLHHNDSVAVWRTVYCQSVLFQLTTWTLLSYHLDLSLLSSELWVITSTAWLGSCISSTLVQGFMLLSEHFLYCNVEMWRPGLDTSVSKCGRIYVLNYNLKVVYPNVWIGVWPF